MNRTKKSSRRHELSQKEVQEARDRRKIASRLYRSITERTPKGELLRMATLLAIPRRSKMNIDQLRDAIYERTK